MARTEAGAVLTNEHRRAQLQVRSGAVSDFIQLWPLWEGDEASFRRLLDAAVPLVRTYHRASGVLARSYYEAFRRAERVEGSATPILATLDLDDVIAGLYATGLISVRRALVGGRTPQAAMEAARIRTSGSVTRQVLNGGRHTIVNSTAADKQAKGWARVTANEPCGFCAVLASRGPVYSEDTVDFKAHDWCACAGEPFYRGSEWPGKAREFKRLYNEVAAGSDNPINEMRKALSHRH